MDPNQVASYVNACISSESELQTNCSVIFDNIASNSPSFNQEFIQTVCEVITSKDQPPTSKFNALLLFVKATQLKNMVFVQQVSESKDLLNYLFQSAQFNKKKPLEEKGKTFFNKKPSPAEKEIGTSYLRLILEALKYWAITYGSPDQKESGYVFHLMFATLSRHQILPQTEVDDFQFKILILESNQSYFEKKKEEVLPEAKKSLAQEHVSAAIVSGNEFIKSYKMCILSQSGNYNDDFLKAIYEVLISKEHTPVNKFYALYLLAKMTEFCDDVLIDTLTKYHDLLNKMFQDCQFDKKKSVEERGKKFFSKTPSPTESLLGQCYLNLAIEVLYYWGKTYGSKEKKDATNVFWLMYITLESVGVKMPKSLEYFETKVDSAIESLGIKLDGSLNK